MNTITLQDMIDEALTEGTDLYNAIEGLVGRDTSDRTEMAVTLMGVRLVLAAVPGIEPSDIVREVLRVGRDGTYIWATVTRKGD
jgi:hypothetical protein